MKMLKNKKGSFFTLIIVVLLVVILTTAFFTLRKKQNPSDKFIGERQYGLIITYQEGEKALFYLDQSAKYSAYNTIYEIGQRGGREESDCGDYLGYSLWVDFDDKGKIKECYPEKKNLEENFKLIFNEKLDNYLMGYEGAIIPLNNYQVSLNNNLDVIGKAEYPLVIQILSVKETISDRGVIDYTPSNTEIDIYLKNINSPLTGIGQCIIDAEKRTKVPSFVILSVAIHESNYGRSGLASSFCPVGKNPPNKKSYNLFGYKGKGTAGGCEWKTWECLSENQKKDFDIIECHSKCENEKDKCSVWAEFRSYNNQCESINDFADLISKSSRYKEAMQYAVNPGLMVDKIREAGYATDPNWARGVNKLMRIAQNKISSVQTESATT